jgi:hypothetical protein
MRLGAKMGIKVSWSSLSSITCAIAIALISMSLHSCKSSKPYVIPYVAGVNDSLFILQEVGAAQTVLKIAFFSGDQHYETIDEAVVERVSGRYELSIYPISAFATSDGLSFRRMMLNEYPKVVSVEITNHVSDDTLVNYYLVLDTLQRVPEFIADAINADFAFLFNDLSLQYDLSHE